MFGVLTLPRSVVRKFACLRVVSDTPIFVPVAIILIPPARARPFASWLSLLISVSFPVRARCGCSLGVNVVLAGTNPGLSVPSDNPSSSLDDCSPCVMCCVPVSLYHREFRTDD
jgi:hypothetical protein